MNKKEIDSFIGAFIEFLKSNPSSGIIDFLGHNSINMELFIEFIEQDKFNLKSYFLEKLKNYGFKEESLDEGYKKLISLVNYFYTEISKEKIRNSLSEFVPPPREAYEYKMNNDSRLSSNRFYFTELHSMSI